MQIEYDSKKLEAALRDFYNATHINIRFVEKDRSYTVTKLDVNNPYCRAIQSVSTGIDGCRTSDGIVFEKCTAAKCAQMHVCHAGLVDVAVPVMHGDVIVGYLIMGPMKREESFESARKCIERYGLPMEHMKHYYDELSLYSSEAISSIANVAVMLTKYILLENMLKLHDNRNIERFVSYIGENFEKRITIQSIEEATHISKSVLYKNVHEAFGCTISEYIAKKRIEKSIHLLEATDLSMDEIAQKIGFSSGSYFGKMFKKERGISPLKFRKLCRGIKD